MQITTIYNESSLKNGNIDHNNGVVISDAEMKDEDFFFKSIIDGGKLGWTKEDVWYMDKNSVYPKLVK